MEKFYSHLHAMVSEGLYRKSGTFYVMPKVERLKVIQFAAQVYITKKEYKKVDITKYF